MEHEHKIIQVSYVKLSYEFKESIDEEVYFTHVEKEYFVGMEFTTKNLTKIARIAEQTVKKEHGDNVSDIKVEEVSAFNTEFIMPQ